MTGRLFGLAVALAVPVIALSFPDPGQAQPAYRATCRSEDLRGTWVADVLISAVPEAMAFNAKHPAQYIRFGPRGAYVFVARAQPLPDKAAIEASLDRADAADPASFVARIVDDQGRMLITRNGKPWASYMCVMEDDRMVWNEVKGNPTLIRVFGPAR